MSDAMLGVDQIIKVLDVVIEGGNVADKVGKADSVMAKLMAVMPLTDDILRLMSLSPSALRAQYKDLDETERESLRVHIKDKFDIANDTLEAQLELGLELVSDTVELIDRAVSYAKSFNKKG